MFTLREARKFIFGLLFCLFTAGALAAQTTIFTYQGRLTDSAGTAANYDFEFRLFTVESGSSALATNQRFAVPVSGNVFTVRLDFGANFDGQPRWLEIAVKPAGSANPFTVLNPRQPIDSAPYAMRSLNSQAAETAINSTQLGGVAANQFVQTGDTRLTDERNPLAGSNNYVQNQNAAPQTTANFNIAGTGSANVINSATQYNLGGNRLLSISNGTNLFAGINVGTSSTSGNFNAFFGTNAGAANTTANDNTFFGFESGKANTIGEGNVFVGKSAGVSNTEGGFNSFFGKGSGDSNTTGSLNSFVGVEAGGSNTDGGQNTFMGSSAGFGNTGGSFNSFFGSQGVGFNNTSGNSNAFFGAASGYNNTEGSNNSFFGSEAGNNNTTGNNNAALGSGANVGAANLTFATAIGAGTVVSTSNTIALGRSNGMDKVRVFGLGAAGATALCRNANNEISTCSSSLRYKTNIASFNSGLNLVNRLRPITFDWKEGGMADLGLGAEDVEKIEPLLVTYNQAGEVEGVKYDRLGVVLLNAVKEQQAQIETQQTQIEAQQRQLRQQQTLIDGLRKLVCQNSPQAEVCRKGENK